MYDIACSIGAEMNFVLKLSLWEILTKRYR